MKYLGEIFALITALGWALSSLFFEKASKRADSISVNVIRLVIGIIFLGVFTLTSPILIIPISYLFFKEKTALKEIIGACISVLGIVLFFYK